LRVFGLRRSGMIGSIRKFSTAAADVDAGFAAVADVDAGFAAVDCHRSVARIVVQKWTTTGELVLHV